MPVVTIIPSIKRFQKPTYTADDWTALNPLLLKGEKGYECDVDGNVVAEKIGPGRWNDLPYYSYGKYPYSDLVTNPIGDISLGSNQFGRYIVDMIKNMICPYQVPAISGLQVNDGPAYGATRTREIGNALSGSITIKFVLSNPGNLVTGNNLYIYANGIFNEEGWQVYNNSTITLTLVNTLNPAIIMNYRIDVKVAHKQGESNVASATLSFVPKIIYGNSTLATLTALQFAAIGNKHTVITSNYKRDYSFTGINYHYVGIPDMLGLSNPVYTDITDVNRPAGISIEDLGLLSVNNGVGTYNYRILRSTYKLLNSVKLRIS
jgi:flagellar biosynthesis protein FliQ